MNKESRFVYAKNKYIIVSAPSFTTKFICKKCRFSGYSTQKNETFV